MGKNVLDNDFKTQVTIINDKETKKLILQQWWRKLVWSPDWKLVWSPDLMIHRFTWCKFIIDGRSLKDTNLH